ncbi:MAG TPA: hypothetical protein VF105_02700 [Gemmatimonadaceae bacterium]
MADPKVPWWLILWNVVLTGVLIWVVVVMLGLRTFAKDIGTWNQQFHRWANHYYWCDSSHRDEAKCAQWSDHIPPPPPPPMY